MTKIFFHRITKALALTAVIGIGLASIIATNGNSGADTQSYALAYSALSDRSIKVRWSVDGATWNDSNVPNQSWATGLDIASTPDKLAFQISGRDITSKKVRILQALSVEYWSDKPVEAMPPDEAKSVPEITFLGSGKWLVVYRIPGVTPDVGDSIAARILNTSITPPQYTGDNIFGFAGYDTLTIGRPAVESVNNRVVLAWQTQEARPGLHVGVGMVNQGQINWGNHVFLPMNEPAVCDAVRSAPVLTHDHGAFYLGFLCSRQDSVWLRLYILKSTDGYAWNYYGNWDNRPYGIPANSYLGLAGRADGSLIALALTADQGILAAKCSGGDACKEQGNITWQNLDAFQFFTIPPNYAPFAFASTGQPARKQAEK